LGTLKAKLAKLRAELVNEASGGGPKGEGFEVAKAGEGRAVLIGFPSVGKASPRGRRERKKKKGVSQPLSRYYCPLSISLSLCVNVVCECYV
jgi:hypothetical protein